MRCYWHAQHTAQTAYKYGWACCDELHRPLMNAKAPRRDRQRRRSSEDSLGKGGITHISRRAMDSLLMSLASRMRDTAVVAIGSARAAAPSDDPSQWSDEQARRRLRPCHKRGGASRSATEIALYTPVARRTLKTSMERYKSLWRCDTSSCKHGSSRRSRARARDASSGAFTSHNAIVLSCETG